MIEVSEENRHPNSSGEHNCGGQVDNGQCGMAVVRGGGGWVVRSDRCSVISGLAFDFLCPQAPSGSTSTTSQTPPRHSKAQLQPLALPAAMGLLLSPLSLG